MKTITCLFSLLVTLLFCSTNNLQAQTTRAEAPSGISDPFYPAHPNTNVPFSSSNLPVVIITMKAPMASKTADTRVEADMKIIYRTNGSRNNIADTISTNLTDTSIINYAGRIGIKYRGNSSYYNSNKKPFSVRTEDVGGNKKEVSILGMGSDSDWALLAPYSDKSLMRDVLTFDLMRGYLEYVPTGKFCELILDGVYQGVYIVTARVKRGSNRLDLPKPKASGDGLTGGYHLEIDRDNEPGFYSNYSYVGQTRKHYYQFKYPEQEDYTAGMDAQKNYIINKVREFEDVMASFNYKDSVTGYRKYLDVQSVIDYMLAQELTHNVDGYRLSTPIYKYPDSKDPRFKMSIWDFNISLGNADYYGGYLTTGWSWALNSTAEPQNPPFWFAKLLADEDFKKELRLRWMHYRKTNVASENIEAKIDSLAALLDEAQARNFQAWKILGTYVWPNYHISTSWNGELIYLRNWLSQRVNWMDSQLNFSIDNSITKNICEGNFYFFGNKNLTEPGVYYHVFKSSLDADSTVELTLNTIPHPAKQIINAITCEGKPYIFGEKVIFEAGIYQDTLQSINGCDSVIELTLTVNPAYLASQTASICYGGTYSWRNRNLVNSGIYSDTLQNISGCDSIIQLTLTVFPKIDINLGSDTTIKADQKLLLDAGNGYKSYVWSTGETTQTILVDSNLGVGNHTIWVAVTNENGCNTSDTIQVTIQKLSSIAQLPEEEQFLLYPNPTSGKINLEFENISHRNIAIYNASGEQVYNKKHHARKVELDLSNFSTGTYILKIDNTIQKKIILKQELK